MAANRILRDIKGTHQFRLFYYCASKFDHVGYTDSD